MELIGNGDWNSGRWSELIDRSLIFSCDSGLESDSSRSEIIGAANDEIGSAGYSDRLTAMLCMLGESVVIVPNDSLDGGDCLGDISSVIEARGF